jgi:cell division septation protein DedD
MNFNRLAGIFISSTIVIWLLIFALSPQPKYQTTNNVTTANVAITSSASTSGISTTAIPIASELTEDFSNMEPLEIEDSNFTVKIEDNISSAKSIIEEVDFNRYVYKVGAFSSSETATKVIQSLGDAGFPAFAQPNQSNKTLTTVLVGPFASKDDIRSNQAVLNKIAETTMGEIITWNP